MTLDAAWRRWVAGSAARTRSRSCSSLRKAEGSAPRTGRPEPSTARSTPTTTAAASSPKAIPAIPARSSRRAASRRQPRARRVRRVGPRPRAGQLGRRAARRRFRRGDRRLDALRRPPERAGQARLRARPRRGARARMAASLGHAVTPRVGPVRDIPLRQTLAAALAERHECAGRLSSTRRCSTWTSRKPRRARRSAPATACRWTRPRPPRRRTPTASRWQRRTTSPTCSARTATSGCPLRRCSPRGSRGCRPRGGSCGAEPRLRRTSWTAATSTRRRRRRCRSSGRGSSYLSRGRTPRPQDRAWCPCCCSSTTTTRSRGTRAQPGGRGNPACRCKTVRAARDAHRERRTPGGRTPLLDGDRGRRLGKRRRCAARPLRAPLPARTSGHIGTPRLDALAGLDGRPDEPAPRARERERDWQDPTLVRIRSPACATTLGGRSSLPCACGASTRRSAAPTVPPRRGTPHRRGRRGGSRCSARRASRGPPRADFACATRRGWRGSRGRARRPS